MFKKLEQQSHNLKSLFHEVLEIYSSGAAFTVLTESDRLISWGHPGFGGFNRHLRQRLESSDIKYVCSTMSAFGALNKNGEVFAWGNPNCGGNLGDHKSFLKKDVEQLISNHYAFAALKKGKVCTWGYGSLGGDSSHVIYHVE